MLFNQNLDTHNCH